MDIKKAEMTTDADLTANQVLAEIRRDYKYLFTIVIPVFDVSCYLEAAIDSVIEQSIGFQENIQLILIDNASTDEQKEVCERYLSQYIENIVYIKLKRESTIGEIRNAGIPYIKGKYVDFMDANDEWDRNACQAIVDFLEHQTITIELECIVCRRASKESISRSQFRYSQVADIFAHYNFLHLSINAIFFLSETVRMLRFEEQAAPVVDIQFLHTIIFRTGKYGMCTGAHYFFRNTPEISKQSTDAEAAFHNDELRQTLGFLVNASMERYGEVIPYVQHFILQQVIRYLKEKHPSSTPEETQSGMAIFEEYLKYVPEYMIMRERFPLERG